jgi:hypothetical protein
MGDKFKIGGINPRVLLYKIMTTVITMYCSLEEKEGRGDSFAFRNLSKTNFN